MVSSVYPYFYSKILFDSMRTSTTDEAKSILAPNWKSINLKIGIPWKLV
jgi:hypothetical protein